MQIKLQVKRVKTDFLKIHKFLKFLAITVIQLKISIIICT